jgi:hypothetical protein
VVAIVKALDVPSRRGAALLVLAAILATAAALRTMALAYGLPAVYNPDETPILNRALALRNDLKPQNFVYPSLYFYLLFAWEGLYFVAGRALGVFDSLAAFQREFFVDPSRHFLAGRVFSVLCGTATVAGVYAFGRRLYGRATGLAAAAALAVSPIAVRDAHYVKLDIPTTMFVVFAHAALAILVVTPAAAARRRSWIAAGFLSGLAVSTQYYAVFLGFTILGVAIADLRRSGDARETMRLFAWATAASAAGFFAGTPFLLFDLQRALADIAHVREVDVDRALVGGAFSAAGPYLRILFRDAMGWPVWIAAVAGFGWALLSDWRRGLLLVSFFVPFFAFISNTVPMSRYLNPVLPIVAVAAGFALVRAGRALPAGGRAATVLLTAASLVPGLLSSLEWDRFLGITDTRTLAGDFITSTVPAGRSFLVQPYGPPLRPSREALIEGLRSNLGSEAHASPKFRHMLALDPYPQPSYRLLYLGDNGHDMEKIYVLPQEFPDGAGLDPLRRRGIEYVVLKKTNVPNPEIQGLEAALAREATRIAEFSPYRADATAEERSRVPPFLHNTAAVVHPALARPGPIVEVWRVGPGQGGSEAPARALPRGSGLQ